MNKAGDRFVASAPLDDQVLSPNGGTMRVYQYSPSGSSSWTQVGADMGGYSTNDYYGTVAINGTGDRWHFLRGDRNNRRIKIYQESGGSWSVHELSPIVHLFMVIHIVAPQLILMSKETLSVWELPEIQAQ